MNTPIRYTLPCLLAAGTMIMGFSALTTATATAGDAEVGEASAEDGPMAQAGLGGLLKKKGKTGAAKETKATAPAPAPEPNTALREGIKCIDDLTPTDVQSGVVREYDVTEGMSVDQRTGFLDRQPVEMTNGCFLGEIKPTECRSLTVNEDKYDSYGNSNDWEVQCVYSDDPGAGMITNKDEYPYAVDRIPGGQFMLLCGHAEKDAAGNEYPCDSGSNSGRAGVWKEQLAADGGKEQLGFCVNEISKQSLTYIDNTHDDGKYAGGRWVYCHYYNKQSKKALFGYEFLQKAK